MNTPDHCEMATFCGRLFTGLLVKCMYDLFSELKVMLKGAVLKDDDWGNMKIKDVSCAYFHCHRSPPKAGNWYRSPGIWQ